jgi:DnaK suppressor protein
MLTRFDAGHMIFHSSGRIFGQDDSGLVGVECEAMDKKKLDAFKKRLEERQRELRFNVSRTAQDGREADLESAQDVADRAANSYTKEFLFSQSNSERQTLQMVDGALERIREGSFGECIACGEEINPKRLEAVPWTRHCIECQEKAEQGLLEATGT